MAKKSILIIGGGAAGMMAAITAARHGADVTILEKNARVGKKILATGNGRCNFTNIGMDISSYNGKDPRFAVNALEKFSVADTLKFFEGLGIEYKVEDMGKVFPMSDQASSILDVLMYELDALGVKTVCGSNVCDIRRDDHSFAAVTRDGKEYRAECLILAAGGKAMPAGGPDGNGYDLAVRLGHGVTELFPALVQLMLEGAFFKRVDGVKLVGTAEIICDDRSIAKDRGDILFTEYGVSGPPVLQISRKAVELLSRGKDVYLKINMMDTMSGTDLKVRVERRLKMGEGKPADFCFVGLVNKRLIPVLLMEAGIKDIKKKAADITDEERDNMIDKLTGWRFRVRGSKGWTNAQVTAGGIVTTDIDSATMGSKLVKGLYFAGEMIDIDGQCGGYNLQWAWSSGYMAGLDAAK
jgi:predicted Rossmann fold flavoprotein